ncbi:MAG: trypsin-like serine protease [Dysgonamonadaceae bacterium]|jgi:hypothetical protein|nr:trypsin-like serine protease [Dysgonamonadaceae bacterium]
MMKKNYFFAVLFFLFAAAVVAQTETDKLPPSFKVERNVLAIPETYRLEFKKNVQQLLDEDEADMKQGMPLRFAVRNTVDIKLDGQNMTRSQLSPDKSIRQYVVSSEGAKGLILMFDELYIPEGGELYVYDNNRRNVRLFTHDNNRGEGRTVSGALYGDAVTLEYVPSALSNEDPRITICDIGYIYRSNQETQESVNCYINTNCSEGDNWTNQIKGVVALSTNNSHSYFFCSGSLVNNVREDGTPYILTANHCTQGMSASNYNTLFVEFFMESTSTPNTNCTTVTYSSSKTKSMSGGSLVVTTSISGSSDGSLIKLNNAIPADWEVYYNGWDARDIAATSGVGIHHPDGLIKKISTFTTPLTTSTWSTYSETGKTNAHWKVTWAATAHGNSPTYGGSSGSPIFNQDGLIVGTLTGGSSYCSTPTSADYYGKFAYHWDKDNSAAKHFKNYLDPDNTGILTLQGYDPHALVLTGTPVATAATELTPVGFTANWNALANAEKYFLSVYQKGPNDAVIYLEGYENKELGNVLSYAITDLPYNTQYFYTVKAGYHSQVTDASNEIGVATLPPTFEYLAPVATDATEVTGESFLAHWDEMSDAVSYQLNVYYKLEPADFTDVVNFTDRKMPAGWTKNSVAFYTQENQYGQAAPALCFGSNEYIQSPDYEKPVKSLSFWYRGISANSSNALIIYGYVNQEWVELDRITPIANAVGGVTFTKSDFPETCTAVKILHARVGGYTAIDDIEVIYGTYASIDFVGDFDRKNVENVLVYPVSDLDPESDYFYSVLAYNGTKYSKVSNEIMVTTGIKTAIPSVTTDSKSRILTDAGYLYIHSDEANQAVRVLNGLGQVIVSRLMNGHDYAISRRNLPAGIYIVRVGTETFKVRL